jgi:hypothetical protein
MYSPRDDSLSRLARQLKASRREGSEVPGDRSDTSSGDPCKLGGPSQVRRWRTRDVFVLPLSRSGQRTGRVHNEESLLWTGGTMNHLCHPVALGLDTYSGEP